ncbi:MAG: sensor histidine kinase [Sphaerochaeta sp.]
MIFKRKGKNNFFFMLVTPLLLAFVLLVIIPIVSYVNDPSTNGSHLMNSSNFELLNELETAGTEDEMIAMLEMETVPINVIVLKNDRVIYNQIQIEDAATKTLTKEITLQNQETYDVYASFVLIDKKFLFIGLIIRYILLIFCFFLLFYSNKMRKHLKNLEMATENIASGDYDTPIVSKDNDSFIFLDNSLEKMRIQIREDRHQLSRFFAGVSHDLKTPLSSIIGYTEALQDGMAKNEEEEQLYLSIIHDKSTILVERIASLISYIKINDQGFKTTLKMNNLYDFLDDFIERSKIELELNHIEFKSKLNINREYTTKFDTVLLDRALENLIENAIKYGDNAKPIDFSVSQSYDGITITVSNYNKSGITKESLEHIFEPFYRGDNSRKGKGFGLGLSTVKSIISSHGWKISSFLNEADSCLSFSINIPIY